jgi:uncharacterized protein (DUF2249 family)
MQIDLSKIDPKEKHHIIKGLSTQLKNVDVMKVPRNKLGSYYRTFRIKI